jgi:hypothetical protein
MLKKPVYKKWWFWVIIAVIVMGALGSSMDESEEKTNPVVKNETASEKKTVDASDNNQEKKDIAEPTDEEWQASYKDILLSEARTYIELTVKGTMSKERLESANGVLKQQAEKITGPDKEKFNELVTAVERENLKEAKRLYISLGGEDFEELKKVPAPKKTESKEKAEQSSKPGDIGMDVEGFRKAFNSTAKNLNLIDMTLGKLKVQDGAVQDVFTYKISDYVYLQGSINKSDGSVREVTMVGAGDGTAQSGTDILVTIGLLIASTNPDLTTEERAGVLQDLGLLSEGVDISQINQSTKRNGIKYTIKGSKELGVWFIASDANEK